jgi:hypothetical protein
VFTLPLVASELEATELEKQNLLSFEVPSRRRGLREFLL